MSQREHEANRNRTLALLHKLAGYVVDGRDVIGVNGVPQAKTVGEQRCSHEERVMAERNASPQPRTQIEHQQDGVKADDSAAEIVGSVVEQHLQSRGSHSVREATNNTIGRNIATHQERTQQGLRRISMRLSSLN